MKKLIGLSPLYLLLVLWVLFISVPLLWIFLSAFKTNAEIISSPWNLPTEWQWENFKRAWYDTHFYRYFINSVIYTAISATLGTLISAMAAYVLSRYKFKGNRLVYMYFVLGLFVPFYLTMIPTWQLFRQIGILGNPIGLILLYIVWSLPWSVFILYGYFEYLPQELMDAASIDGASDFQIFHKIMMPLARGGLTAMFVFNTLWIWNDFLMPLLFLSDEDRRPLPLGLVTLFKAKKALADWSAILAATVIMLIPVVVVFVILQKQVVKGAMAGALKG